MKQFKNIWADNGDAISRHYTGTGSTHSEATKSGKINFQSLLAHGGTTLGRLYFQIFEDDIK